MSAPTVNPISTGSMYVIPNRSVVSHAVPMGGYLRGAALRSPLDLNYGFASEQTIDELAHAVKMDPLAFRRKNIGGQRWAVDSWIYANGENPAIVEAEKWYISSLAELPAATR